MFPPKHLDEQARTYWLKHYKGLIDAGVLTDLTREHFALVCQSFSDLRQAESLRDKKLASDIYLRLVKELGYLKKKPAEKTQPIKDELDLLME